MGTACDTYTAVEETSGTWDNILEDCTIISNDQTCSYDTVARLQACTNGPDMTGTTAGDPSLATRGLEIVWRLRRYLRDPQGW